MADRYGTSLADAVMARRDEFDLLFAQYSLEGVSAEALAYILIGCFALDWDGLDLTEERGWRVAALPRPNGDLYTLWARENGPGTSLRGYYWGSHNSYFDDVVLTSFGDHHSDRHALPDLAWQMINAVATVDASREVRLAAALALQSRTESLLEQAGCLALSLRDGPLDTPAMVAACPGPDPVPALNLLEAIDYIEQDANGDWSARIVLLTQRDAALVAAVRQLMRGIMAEWLEANYDALRQDSADLTPTRFGVSYESAFTQIWHYVFGAANRELAARGYFLEPYRANTPWPGMEPVIWDPALSDYR